MVLRGIRYALWHTFKDINSNHTLQMAAALSYYYVLSLFPALIFLSAVAAYLLIPDLFIQALALMGTFVPLDSMGLVRWLLSDLIPPNLVTLLSFGF